jgi:hypothetical protein
MHVVADKDPDRMACWLVEPCSFERFMSAIAERKALLLTRPYAPDRNKGCFDIEDVWTLLEGKLRYGLNVDVTLFTANKNRETFNFNGYPSDGKLVCLHAHFSFT